MIDFSSDTVTKPCSAMRQIMAEADVADDVYDGDPTVMALQNYASEMFGKEAALFAPSGTQTNLLALLTHCQRGDEYIVGQQAHTYKYEAGGAAVLGSIQPQPIEFEKDGTIDLQKVEKNIKPYDQHFAKTKLLCIENTLSGVIVPYEYLLRAGAFCKEHNLLFHLDGARLMHAVVETGQAAHEIVKPFDSVSICLSKGLGAPVGSLLLGPQDFIERAKHWRKMLGGGMRQSGIIAAGALYALQNNVDRLKEDHAKALYLAEALSEFDLFEIDMEIVQTNIVFVSIPLGDKERLFNFMREKGIKLGMLNGRVRIVMHMDVSQDDVETLISALKEYCEHVGS